MATQTVNTTSPALATGEFLTNEQLDVIDAELTPSIVPEGNEGTPVCNVQTEADIGYVGETVVA